MFPFLATVLLIFLRLIGSNLKFKNKKGGKKIGQIGDT